MDIGEQVAAAMDVDIGAFEARVAREAETLKAELEVGTFDNAQANVGLEYEFYGAHDPTSVLRRVPEPLLTLINFERELGRHNAELTANPQPLGPHGFAAVRHEVQAAVQSAHQAAAASEDMRLVSDGLLTIPPVGETAAEYLSACEYRHGVRLCPNVPDVVRYHLLSNSQTYDPPCVVDLPNTHFETPTVVPSSMTSTIQPHYQMPIAADLPRHFRYALRVTGPLLALAANSPLAPPSLYEAGTEMADVLAHGWMEGRIRVFESVMNDPNRPAKVRFPHDLDSTAEAVDRLVTDPTFVPMELEPNDRFDAQFAHLRHKHGTYWRWVRPVFEGATEAAANARIEFRPLPAQPTVRDSIAFLAAFVGLMEGLVRANHPVADQPWDRARENFYEAAEHALDGNLAWITADGETTTDTDILYADLFEHARIGLEARGFENATATQYLQPLRDRVERRVTPASWTRDRLREHGGTLENAVVAAKHDYIRQQAATLVEGQFTDWPGV